MATVILFNKPFRVLSQFTDGENRSTLAQYIDEKGLYPAGRLDFDSEGLLLLTDDGALQHRITHPSRKLDKSYWVQVEGSPSEDGLRTLLMGVTLNDGPAKAKACRIIEEPAIWPRDPPIRQRKNSPTAWLEITISEGRNRQVRRMTAAIGLPTLRLIRARIGDWQLDDLMPGEHKKLQVHMPSAKTQRKRQSDVKPQTRNKTRRQSPTKPRR